MMRGLWGQAGAAIAVALALVTGCAAEGNSQSVEPGGGSGVSLPDPSAFSDTVQIDAVTAHLTELERIADENDGNRALGTSGYDASVDYVAGLLRDAGFDVQTPEFEVNAFEVVTESLDAGDRSLDVRALAFSPSTGPDGLTARPVRVPADETPGCEPEDYDGVEGVAGSVVLVDRGACTFSVKEQVAADRGAAALLVVNNEDGPLADAGLSEGDDPRIPVGGLATGDADTVAQAPTLTLVLDTTTESRMSRNVIAETTTGSPDNVVVVGAHLDSVPEGPGINDNGTGVAAVLETARQLGADPAVTNKVRFAFWGAEEVGLVGSTRYVEGLSDDERRAVALYLNFDMLGSPNPGYLVFDGDDSDGEGAGPGPEGSAGIERTFARFFDERGIAVSGTDFDGRSDYGPFVAAGIPAGGVFSGADEVKSDEQAELWGGTAGETFDPNYHTAQDDTANVDRAALAAAAAAVGYGTAFYAHSVDGPDGVPVGDARVQARETFTE